MHLGLPRVRVIQESSIHVIPLSLKRTKLLHIDTILFCYLYRVTVGEGVAVVLDLHNLDHYLHAFTYPDWKHITSFGKRGEAPEEMLSSIHPVKKYTLDRPIYGIDINEQTNTITATEVNSNNPIIQFKIS